MSILSQTYREVLSKDKDKSLGMEARTLFSFPTGIDLLDYKNGRIIYPKGGEPYMAGGVEEGNYIMLIGKSASGKTSASLQIAGNIIRPYEEGLIIHDDIEQATDDSRARVLLRIKDHDEFRKRYIHKREGITTESFYKRVKKLAELKLERREELEITTDALDSEGNKIKILPPTVWILDSLALLVPEKVADEDELSGK